MAAAKTSKLARARKSEITLSPKTPAEAWTLGRHYTMRDEDGAIVYIGVSSRTKSGCCCAYYFPADIARLSEAVVAKAAQLNFTFGQY